MGKIPSNIIVGFTSFCLSLFYYFLFVSRQYLIQVPPRKVVTVTCLWIWDLYTHLHTSPYLPMIWKNKLVNNFGPYFDLQKDLNVKSKHWKKKGELNSFGLFSSREVRERSLDVSFATKLNLLSKKTKTVRSVEVSNSTNYSLLYSKFLRWYISYLIILKKGDLILGVIVTDESLLYCWRV